jgi:hypothetical protein
MKIEERIAQRFHELSLASQQVQRVQRRQSQGSSEYVESGSWAQWSTSALHLLELAFGSDSVHFLGFKTICDN